MRNKRIDRVFPGVGRINLSSGTRKVRLYGKIDSMLTDLYEEGYLDILRAIKNQRLTLREVYQAKRAGRLSYCMADVLLARPLRQAVEEWLPTSARAESSRRRYEVSWAAIFERASLGEGAAVLELREVSWKRLSADWPNSSADWNRARSAVSRFLTMYLGDKHHPFRREIMTAIPRQREPRGRVPDITPELLWRILGHVPDELSPAIVVLAATGLRVRSEYLRLDEHHLLPHTRSIQVPAGAKTESSSEIIRVGPETWAWVQRAVPEPAPYKRIYRAFKRGAREVGSPDLTLHDLRHLHGMILSDAGESEARIQSSLRHADPSMTRRYTMQRDRGETGRTVDGVLFG